MQIVIVFPNPEFFKVRDIREVWGMNIFGNGEELILSMPMSKIMAERTKERLDNSDGKKDFVKGVLALQYSYTWIGGAYYVDSIINANKAQNPAD
jgi:hypothetical protein